MKKRKEEWKKDFENECKVGEMVLITVIYSCFDIF